MSHPLILPPLVAEISRDYAAGWAGTPRWLGNVWDENLREAENST